MDSGVRLRASSPLQLRLVLRAQKAACPNDDEPHLFERVRHAGGPALAEGFVERESSVQKVVDPGDDGRTLDTFYEIVFTKDTPSLETALATLKFAVSLEKRA